LTQHATDRRSAQPTACRRRKFDGGLGNVDLSLQLDNSFGEISAASYFGDIEDGSACATPKLVSAVGGNWKCMPRIVPLVTLFATLPWVIGGFCPLNLSWTERTLKEAARILLCLISTTKRPSEFGFHKVTCNSAG
jgi:hypothetical protein